jgi:hypothetical protein
MGMILIILGLSFNIAILYVIIQAIKFFIRKNRENKP